MPLWTNDPSQSVQTLLPSVPGYSAGSKNQSLPNTRLIVSNSVLTANVVTLTVKVVEGNIPAVGSSIFVSGTQNGSGAMNTSVGIALSAVSIDSVTGLGTVSYPLTHANIPTAADEGVASVLVPEIAEVSTPNQAYKAFAISRSGNQGQDFSITVSVQYPSAPAAVSWSVQAAINNVDAEFIDIMENTSAGTFTDSGAPGATTTGQFWPGTYNFVRYKDKGSSGGTNPTVIAKFLI
jgi:hypothetical protein